MKQRTTAQREPAPATTDRLITTREVVQRTTLSRSTLWRLSRDGQFPAPVKLTTSRIAWKEASVQRYIDERSANRG